MGNVCKDNGLNVQVEEVLHMITHHLLTPDSTPNRKTGKHQGGKQN